jgi:hypothetical protein
MEYKVNVFHPSKPHSKQQEVLDALDSGERQVLLRAGRKFRKTSLIVSWLIEKAWLTGLSCPYVAPSRVQAKNITWNDHIQRILNHFTEQGLPYRVNESELSVRFPNGGKVQLFGVENKEGLRGISNWGAIGMDEYDDWAEDIFPLIVLPNLMVHKAQAIIAGTPKGFRNIYRLEQSGNWKSFHFRSHDNPDLDREELQRLENEYKSMGEGYYRQEILAQYEKPVGTVYEEWDMDRRYIPFDYEPALPLHLSWDFGVNDPTSILFIQPNGSELRLIDYYEASDANIEHFVQYINAKPYKTASLHTGDIAGRARNLVTGKSPIDALGKHKMFIRTRPIPGIDHQVRNAHKFIPRLYVSKSNPATERFVECILNYKYPEIPQTQTRVNQSNEVPIHDEFSHAMRAWEYYCWNISEPKTDLKDNPPANSVMGFIKKQQEQRELAKEYVGYN